MAEVSVFRLYLLRGTYLLIVVGMGFQVWPAIFNTALDIEHMRGVVRSMLGALTLLAALGIRYPIKMLPLLFFDLIWKIIWVLVIGLPLWSAGQLDDSTRETLLACVMGLVLFPIVIPWGYVFHHYVKSPGDRWTRQRAGPP